ncbi:MAG TPA: Flp family type IVb pilin [Clostridiales bacterium]|nr:Flp family type IVb pilin [Clostridiales bacterium]
MLKLIFAYARLLKNDQRGQGMTEYALVIAFVAIAVLGAVTLFGDQLGTLFTNITNGIS